MDGCYGPGAPVGCGNSHVQLPFLPGARYEQFARRMIPSQAFPVPQAGSHEMGVVHPAWRSMPVSCPLKAPVFLCCTRRKAQRRRPASSIAKELRTNKNRAADRL